MHKTEPHNIELRYDVKFAGPFESVVFHGSTLLEKHGDADQMVLIFTALTVHPARVARFRELGWLFLTRSPVDPLNSSVLRACYRVSTSGLVSSAGSNSQFDANSRRAVQNMLVKRMDTRFKEIQCFLLRETGRSDLCALVPINA